MKYEIIRERIKYIRKELHIMSQKKQRLLKEKKQLNQELKVKRCFMCKNCKLGNGDPYCDKLGVKLDISDIYEKCMFI